MGNEKIEQQMNTGDKIALFMQRHRKTILILLVFIAAGIAISTAFFLIRGTMEKKAIAAVEILERRKTELENTADNPNSAETSALLDEINDFTSSTFGYAAARGYSLAAGIYFSRSEWSRAEETWTLAVRKAPKTYLASFSFFNAGAAAEEQGKLEVAIGYYRQSLEYTGIFPAAARARFNIGRISEALDDKIGAAEAYRDLINENPDSRWANLAQSRIIFLEKN
ncbi:MAG: tetratricopeptide repeat protein [Treponema sp.]|nr:tetratricopeptide repeat protein [Treponema sp.]